MKNITICMLGFGNVGKAFARLINRKADSLAREYNVVFKIVAIATGSHGRAINLDGIDPNKALLAIKESGTLISVSTISTPSNMEDFIILSKADFVLEISPVNYETGEPATTHIRTALQNKMHAVSANKGRTISARVACVGFSQAGTRKTILESVAGCAVFSRLCQNTRRTDAQRSEAIAATNVGDCQHSRQHIPEILAPDVCHKLPKPMAPDDILCRAEDCARTIWPRGTVLRVTL